MGFFGSRGSTRVMRVEIPSAICRDVEAPLTELSSLRFLVLLEKAFDNARLKRWFASFNESEQVWPIQIQKWIHHELFPCSVELL